MASFGFMIALTLKDAATAEQFIARCPFVQASTSFGGVRTCAERRSRWGDAVAEGFVRMSIGLEPVEPLWRALDHTLNESG
jgi:cystathionine gamma-lyase